MKAKATLWRNEQKCTKGMRDQETSLIHPVKSPVRSSLVCQLQRAAAVSASR